MIEKGVKELIVTLGSKGSLYINKEKTMFKNAYKVEAVDTTAAGDSYTGALAVAFAQDKNIEDRNGLCIKSRSTFCYERRSTKFITNIKRCRKFQGVNT